MSARARRWLPFWRCCRGGGGRAGGADGPTEILARQHWRGSSRWRAAAGMRLEILTGRDKGADRADKLAALAEGRIDILVGTHAVFQKDVAFQ